MVIVMLLVEQPTKPVLYYASYRTDRVILKWQRIGAPIPNQKKEDYAKTYHSVVFGTLDHGVR